MTFDTEARPATDSAFWEIAAGFNVALLAAATLVAVLVVVWLIRRRRERS